MRTLIFTLTLLPLAACLPAGADIADPNDTDTDPNDTDADSDTDADADVDTGCEPSGTLGNQPQVDYVGRLVDESERGVIHTLLTYTDLDDDIVTVTAKGLDAGGHYYNIRTYSVLSEDIDWDWDNCTHTGTLDLYWEYDPCTAGLDMEQTPGLQIDFGVSAMDSTGLSSGGTSAIYTVPGCN